MGTIITAVVVFLVIGTSAYSLYKGKKRGKSIQCGGECGSCHRGCH